MGKQSAATTLLLTTAVSAGNVYNAAGGLATSSAANTAIAACVSTCQPILNQASQCGFPVPANAATALDPLSWNGFSSSTWGSNGLGGASGWGSGSNWGGFGSGGVGVGVGAGIGSGGFGGYGGFGGWKKEKRATTTTSTAAGNGNSALNTGFLFGTGWSNGNWADELQCACSSTNNVNLASVGNSCITCVNNALGVSAGTNGLFAANAGNPCKFSFISPMPYHTN
jgi:hypothetical protein